MKHAQESCISPVELGQRLVVTMAIASPLHSSSLRVAFDQLGARQEILYCSRVKQVKYRRHPLNL